MMIAGRRRNAPRKRTQRVRPTIGAVNLPDEAVFEDAVLGGAVHSLCKSPEILQMRDEAKRRLGSAAAGSSVEDFIKMNTKRIDLDPWRDALEDIQAGRGSTVRSTGELDPVTFDVLVPFLPNLAPTTQQPHLVLNEHKIVIPMYHAAPILMRGRWAYCALMPEPGKGRVLGEEEWVRTLTGRFTAPFSKGDSGEFEEGSSRGPNWGPPGVQTWKVGDAQPGDNDYDE